jgi:plastocyanin
MLNRRLLSLVVVVMLVAAFFSACGPSGGSGTGGGTTGQTVNIEGSEFAFNPATITAKPGERVTVNFKNIGTVEHTFVITELNFKLVAQPGQTTTGTFSAPAQSTTFEVHCDIAGHTEAGMKGELIVQ